uniref:Peroxidase n=1 Tax=Opuntia streptacantha TaxID=393608 RepID=A0A7C9E587_OPUST
MKWLKQMKVSLVFVLLSQLPLSFAKLRVGFYKTSCPQAETIVQQAVQARFGVDKSVTAALLRMHFHDCFVRGCDASILLDSIGNNQAEKASGPNLTVREFELIDQIKSQLEAACPQTVSCADIVTLATRDAVALAGGPQYNAPTGRRDGLVSRASEVNVPGPTFTVSQARQAFGARGLTLNDMVVLLGGHSVGVAHCSFFQDRLSNFLGTGGPDPTMDQNLVSTLKGTCGSNPNVDPTAFLDQNTSFVLDNQYYNQILNNKGLLQIDQELALDKSSSKMVSNLAANNALFGQSFAKAMIKMGNIQVLEGNAGEIRKNCRVVN